MQFVSTTPIFLLDVNLFLLKHIFIGEVRLKWQNSSRGPTSKILFIKKNTLNSGLSKRAVKKKKKIKGMQTGATHVFLWNLIDSDIKDWIWRDKMIVNKSYFISNIYPGLPTFRDWIKQPAVYRIRVYWHFTTARVVVCKQIRVNICLFDLCLFTVYTESQLNLWELKTNVCSQGEACEKMSM